MNPLDIPESFLATFPGLRSLNSNLSCKSSTNEYISTYFLPSIDPWGWLQYSSSQLFLHLNINVLFGLSLGNEVNGVILRLFSDWEGGVGDLGLLRAFLFFFFGLLRLGHLARFGVVDVCLGCSLIKRKELFA